MANTPTIQADQIADAIVAVPGNRIEMLSAPGPASGTNATGTFAAVPAASGNPATFAVPVEAEYDIAVDMCGFGNGGVAYAYYRVVFDSGESNEQIIGGDSDESWQLQAEVNVFDYRTKHATVTLIAGTHTCEIQWRNKTGTMRLNADGHHTVTGRSVTGSGAGGEIIEDIDPDGTAVNLTKDVEAVIVSDTVTITADDAVQVDFTGYAKKIDAGINTGLYVRLYANSNVIGGNPLIYIKATNTTTTSRANISFSRRITGLGAGTHTIEVRGLTIDGDGGNDYDAHPTSFQLSVARGGQVPVQENGVTKTSTPAAFNFTGDNFTVTNVGGKAQIGYSGVPEGLSDDLDPVSLSANWSPSAATTWEDVDNGGGDALTTTITGSIGEWIMVVVTGKFFNGTTAHESYIRLDIDGTSYGQAGQDQSAAVAPNAAGTVTLVVPFKMTATSHVVKVQGYCNLTSTSFRNDTTNQGLFVLRAQGGYVKAENVPIFARDSSDTSLINASAAIGAASEMRLLFNDGVRRTATLPLTCDIDTDGIGGRDTGDATGEAAGDLYHLYAVESDTDATKIKLVLSKDAVPGTSGPPSFSVYAYLWTVRITSIGPVVIEPFLMSESGWYEPTAKDLTAYTLDSGNAAVPGTVGSWVDKTTALQALVPPSADEIDIHAFVSSTNQQIFIAPEATPSWTAASAQPYTQRLLVATTAGGQFANSTTKIASPDREFAVQFAQSVSSTWTIQLAGYKNAMYPGSREARATAVLNINTVNDETSNKTLSSGESNKTLTNVGASGQVDFTLPTAAAGLRFRFCVLAAQILRIITDSTSDDIRITSSLTAGASRYVQASTVGNTIELIAVSDALWLAIAVNGTWTVST